MKGTVQMVLTRSDITGGDLNRSYLNFRLIISLHGFIKMAQIMIAMDLIRIESTGGDMIVNDIMEKASKKNEYIRMAQIATSSDMIIKGMMSKVFKDHDYIKMVLCTMKIDVMHRDNDGRIVMINA